MTTITAQSVLSSQNALDPDKRIDTLLLRMPRCILAEFNTYGSIASNAASSRALPTSKIIQDILADPYVPVYWGANQKGMQAGEEINELVKIQDYFVSGGTSLEPRESAWNHAMWQAIKMAEAFAAAGYHKQIVNRLLEPFMHVTVVATSKYQGGWTNFLHQRDHKAADPAMELLAKAVRGALDEAQTQTLKPGEWHTPFVTRGEHNGRPLAMFRGDARITLSVARCASTSYKTVEGFEMSLDRASTIFSKLQEDEVLHASPFEHQAMADDRIPEKGRLGDWESPELGGRLGEGWIQLRKTMPNECC